jgi:hypothetical protein
METGETALGDRTEQTSTEKGERVKQEETGRDGRSVKREVLLVRDGVTVVAHADVWPIHELSYSTGSWVLSVLVPYSSYHKK